MSHSISLTQRGINGIHYILAREPPYFSPFYIVEVKGNEVTLKRLSNPVKIATFKNVNGIWRGIEVYDLINGARCVYQILDKCLLCDVFEDFIQEFVQNV
jgi:hypothetical protein